MIRAGLPFAGITAHFVCRPPGGLISARRILSAPGPRSGPAPERGL
jgi:hypothetical protein